MKYARLASAIIVSCFLSSVHSLAQNKKPVLLEEENL